MSHVVPWPAKDFAMKLSISKWKSICLQFFQTIENHLRAIIKKKSNLIFASKLHMFKLEADVMSFPQIMPDLTELVIPRTRSSI